MTISTIFHTCMFMHFSIWCILELDDIANDMNLDVITRCIPNLSTYIIQISWKIESICTLDDTWMDRSCTRFAISLQNSLPFMYFAKQYIGFALSYRLGAKLTYTYMELKNHFLKYEYLFGIYSRSKIIFKLWIIL